MSQDDHDVLISVREAVATCTTGNGVYFSAGQGFAWETSVPQGIVSIISAVTGTNYVLKDG